MKVNRLFMFLRRFAKRIHKKRVDLRMKAFRELGIDLWEVK